MHLRRALAAFVAASILPTVTVAEDRSFTLRKDVRYGSHQRQTLDIYLPESVDAEAPVIVFFHGGAWSSGRKEVLSKHGKSFASSGIIFVAPNYRLYPDASFPDFIEDSAAAIASSLELLKGDDGSFRPLFLSGWSAGAYNAALLAYDERWLDQVEIPRGTVRGVVGLSGPYEGGYCAGQRCEQIFPEALRADWHIADHVDENDPPALFVVASNDPYVPGRHHEDLAEALNAAGVKSNVLVLSSRSHFATLRSISETGNEVRQSATEFIARESRD